MAHMPTSTRISITARYTSRFLCHKETPSEQRSRNTGFRLRYRPCKAKRPQTIAQTVPNPYPNTCKPVQHNSTTAQFEADEDTNSCERVLTAPTPAKAIPPASKPVQPAVELVLVYAEQVRRFLLQQTPHARGRVWWVHQPNHECLHGPLYGPTRQRPVLPQPRRRVPCWRDFAAHPRRMDTYPQDLHHAGSCHRAAVRYGQRPGVPPGSVRSGRMFVFFLVFSCEADSVVRGRENKRTS